MCTVSLTLTEEINLGIDCHSALVQLSTIADNYQNEDDLLSRNLHKWVERTHQTTCDDALQEGRKRITELRLLTDSSKDAGQHPFAQAILGWKSTLPTVLTEANENGSVDTLPSFEHSASLCIAQHKTLIEDLKQQSLWIEGVQNFAKEISAEVEKDLADQKMSVDEEHYRRKRALDEGISKIKDIYEQTINFLNSKLEEIDQKLKSATAKYEEALASVENQHDIMVEQEKLIDQLKDKKKQIKESINEQKSSFESSRDQLFAENRRQLAEFKRQLDAEDEKMTEYLNALQQEHHNEISALSAELQERTEQKRLLDLKLSAVEQILQERQQLLEEMKAYNARKTAKLQRMRDQIQNNKEVISAEKSKQEELKLKTAELEQKHTQLQAKLKEEQDNLTIQSQEIEALKAKISVLEEQTTNNADKISHMQTKVIELTQKHEKYIATLNKKMMEIAAQKSETELKIMRTERKINKNINKMKKYKKKNKCLIC